MDAHYYLRKQYEARLRRQLDLTALIVRAQVIAGERVTPEQLAANNTLLMRTLASLKEHPYSAPLPHAFYKKADQLTAPKKGREIKIQWLKF